MAQPLPPQVVVLLWVLAIVLVAAACIWLVTRIPHLVFPFDTIAIGIIVIVAIWLIWQKVT